MTKETNNKNNIKSIILVTSFYHMPRSLLELHQALPNTTVYPSPIWPKDFAESTAWLHTKTALHLINEYHKVLVIKLHYFLGDFAKWFGLVLSYLRVVTTFFLFLYLSPLYRLFSCLGDTRFWCLFFGQAAH